VNHSLQQCDRWQLPTRFASSSNSELIAGGHLIGATSVSLRINCVAQTIAGASHALTPHDCEVSVRTTCALSLRIGSLLPIR